MGTKFKSSIGVGLAIAASTVFMVGAANANPIVAKLEDQTNGGGFFAEVTLANAGTNTVKVTADISPPINVGLTEGDILGLWLDIADANFLTGLMFGNEMPTNIISASIVDENNVNAVGTSNNDIGPAGTNYDIGLAFSAQGCGDGCFQTIMFDMTSTGLTSAAFAEQRVGMRVQSIDGEDPFTYMAGSAKLTGLGDGGGGGQQQVPEPGTLLLFALGLVGLGFRGRA